MQAADAAQAKSMPEDAKEAPAAPVFQKAEVRKDFRDAVFWAAHLKTDSDGKAKATITFPDSLTTWQLTALGVTKKSAVGEVLFTLLAVAFPVALIVLGAQRRGRLGGLTWPLAGLLLILEAGAVAMLALRGQILTAPWVGGLPLATAVQVYGLFLLPQLLVDFAYARTFDSFSPSTRT